VMAMAPKIRRMHPPAKSKRSDFRKVSASAAGYDNRWSTVTAPAVRERDEWMCQQCLREGGLVMATEEQLSRPRTKNGGFRELIVDHIVPAHVISRERFHDMDNLESLCDRHHSQKTQDDIKKYGAAPR